MKSLQYWIDISECVCDTNTPIGGCLRCDLEEFQKRYDKALAALKRTRELARLMEGDDTERDWNNELSVIIKELEEVK